MSGHIRTFLCFINKIFLCVYNKIAHIAKEDKGKYCSFPTLDDVFGKREEPNHNHRNHHNRKVVHCNACELHRRNNTCETKDKEDIEDIRTQNVSNGYTAISFASCYNTGCQFGERCTASHNGKTYHCFGNA